jgi:hypothetical protein
MAIPGLASTLLLNFILAWNEAFWTLNLSTLDARTIPAMFCPGPNARVGIRLELTSAEQPVIEAALSDGRQRVGGGSGALRAFKNGVRLPSMRKTGRASPSAHKPFEKVQTYSKPSFALAYRPATLAAPP